MFQQTKRSTYLLLHECYLKKSNKTCFKTQEFREQICSQEIDKFKKEKAIATYKIIIPVVLF